MEQYKVDGMTCAACVAHVEKAVKSVEGVEEVSVSLLTNSMGVSGNADAASICKAVENAGYHAEKKGAEKTGKTRLNHDADVAPDVMRSQMDGFIDRETPNMVNRLVLSVLFLLPLMYLSMGHMMWKFPLPGFLDRNYIGIALTEMILAFVIMYINRRFFISGWKSTMHLAPNMDTLVAMGSGVSFLYSVVMIYAMTYAMATGNHMLVMKYHEELYFESAAMILTLITVGKTLESYSKGKTTSALKGLLELAPSKAKVLRDGKEVEILAEEMEVEDIFVVRPGESIPADGVIIEGASAIDESALTGESVPVDKAVGAEVSLGTINTSGFLKCKTLRVGQDTTLSKIVQMVTDAAATKAPIAKIADRVAGVFTPVVLVLAFLTGLVWMILGAEVGVALSHAITVLVISCPCALGLATPVAIMVGNGIGAKNGILYKTAAALEAAGRADVVILDKTGTITQGKPEVTDVLPAENVSVEELLETAYALEAKSAHPLAKAIVDYVEKDGKIAYKEDLKEFQDIPGNGIQAIYKGALCIAAKEKYVKERLVDDREMNHFQKNTKIDEKMEEGKTALYFLREKHLLGAILVSDVMKEESPKAIEDLKKMGMRVIMLTGDHRKSANTIANKAGVDDVIAEVLPGEKEQVVRRYQEDGKHVLMVGDGINDAPALTRADVGFAIGAGTDIAMDAADVVLVNSKLTDVPAAIRLSRYVIRNIHENLFWAFIYNVIGIPLAAGVWIPITGWTLSPMFGAAAMSLSSFCVVMNALRLNRIHIQSDQTIKVQNPKEMSEQSSMENRKEIQKMKKTIEVEGMMCHNCENHVKKALSAIDGVVSVEANHETDTVVVELEKEVEEKVLFDAISEEGYTPKGIRE